MGARPGEDGRSSASPLARQSVCRSPGANAYVASEQRERNLTPSFGLRFLRIRAII